MRQASRICADTLSLLSSFVVPGNTGLELDKIAREYILSRNAVPSCIGYKGYPNSICCSVNSGAVHCIPNNKPFLPGDVVKLDLVVSFNNWNSDSAITVLVPPIRSEVQRLAETTYQAMLRGIEQAIDGQRVLDISKAIYMAKNEFNVVRQFTGHGIGFKEIHENPQIPNYPIQEQNSLLCAGMTLCVEPIFCAGKSDIYYKEGQWDTWTLDNSLISHWEHTILIKPDGASPEILTLRENEIVP